MVKKMKKSHFTRKGPGRPTPPKGIPGGPSGGNNSGGKGK